MRRTWIIWAGCLALAAPATAAGPSVGDVLPPLEAGSWINAPGGQLTSGDLKGRVVMVEFWATW